MGNDNNGGEEDDEECPCLPNPAQCKVLFRAQSESRKMIRSTEDRMPGYVTAIKADVQ